MITAGWRSGSTAVQRLIISGGDAFIWGEPFQTSRMIARLDRIAREATVDDGAPHRLVLTDELDGPLADQWLATTNPELDYLMAGMRELVQTTYWTPLVQSPFSTWGVKEVTMTADQIRFLRALFPDAHFVGIVRNPVEAYASFRSFVVRGISPSGRPDSQPTWTGGPVSYARVWTEMARALRELAGSENTTVYRYEDINGRADFPEVLGRELSMRLDPTAWSTRVGANKTKATSLLARAEAALVRRLTSEESAQWRYE